MLATASAQAGPEGAGAGATAPGPAPDAELFIVLNRHSGQHGQDEVRQAIEGELQAAGRRHRFVPVRRGAVVAACQEAARLASASGGLLVAAGGDGTLNAAAQAALAQDCPLGIIALGTFNLFARELGLPLDAAEATRVLLRASPQPVQVGWVNQHVFLANAAVGLYPKLLADREEVKRKLGRRRWIAMLAALRSLLQWRHQLLLDVERDGEVTQLRTAGVFVCNNQLQLRRVGIADTVVDAVGQGRLAGVLMGASGSWAKLRMLAAALVGRLDDAPEIDSFTLRSLMVGGRAARRIKVSFDGEVQWMQLPLRFTVAPRPLRVMLPPAGERLAPR